MTMKIYVYYDPSMDEAKLIHCLDKPVYKNLYNLNIVIIHVWTILTHHTLWWTSYPPVVKIFLVVLVLAILAKVSYLMVDNLVSALISLMFVSIMEYV